MESASPLRPPNARRSHCASCDWHENSSIQQVRMSSGWKAPARSVLCRSAAHLRRRADPVTRRLPDTQSEPPLTRSGAEGRPPGFWLAGNCREGGVWITGQAGQRPGVGGPAGSAPLLSPIRGGDGANRDGNFLMAPNLAIAEEQMRPRVTVQPSIGNAPRADEPRALASSARRSSACLAKVPRPGRRARTSAASWSRTRAAGTSASAR